MFCLRFLEALYNLPRWKAGIAWCSCTSPWESIQKVGSVVTNIFYYFPMTRWRDILAKNPLECLNRKIRHQTRLIGISRIGTSHWCWRLPIYAMRQDNCEACNGNEQCAKNIVFVRPPQTDISKSIRLAAKVCKKLGAAFFKKCFYSVLDVFWCR